MTCTTCQKELTMDNRSDPRTGRKRKRAQLAARADQLAQAEHRRETGRGAQADVPGERRVRARHMNILVPVDGSRASENAVRHVIGLSVSGMAVKVHLLN